MAMFKKIKEEITARMHAYTVLGNILTVKIT